MTFTKIVPGGAGKSSEAYLMASAKLKMVESRSPERAALAEAIEVHTGVVSELQGCRDAISQASERRWNVQRALDAIHDARRESDLATPFLAAVATGQPCEAADIERPTIEDREIELAHVREIETWDRTREACEARVPLLEDRKASTKKLIARKAGAVLAASVELRLRMSSAPGPQTKRLMLFCNSFM